MVICGVDPGTTRIGIGIIEIIGSQYKLLHYGLLLDEKLLIKMTLPEKLKAIFESIQTLISQYKFTCIGIENLIFAKNIKTAFPVAYARAMLLLAAAQNNIPIFEPTPTQVKQGVSTKGNADKKQVAFMVKSILGIQQNNKILDDVTDALAIAITTANFRNSWAIQEIVV